jgi:hypothetical protein
MIFGCLSLPVTKRGGVVRVLTVLAPINSKIWLLSELEGFCNGKNGSLVSKAVMAIYCNIGACSADKQHILSLILL